MAPVPLLSARGLKKSFGGRLVLDGLDLELADGMRVGVLGPNGGGKSTLLAILAGVEHADGGTVTRRRDRLEDALEHYDGTVVAVSHDRYFLDRIADRVVVVADGVAHAYEGGWSANLARV